MFKLNVLKFVFMALAVPSLSWAGAVVTYHGRILDAQKHPVESSSVSFRIRVYSPSPEKCLLYEEVRTIDMTNSAGVFVVPIGDGHGTRASSDPGIQIEKVFTNNPSLTFDTTNTPKLVCNSGSSFTPGVLSQRHLVVSFDDHTGVGEQVLPVMDVNFVPFSVSAYDAQNIGGAPANSVLRVSGGNATPLSVANFTELINLITGTSLQYEKTGKLNGSNVPVLANGQVLGWSGGGWTAVTPMTSYAETDPTVKAFAKANLPACGANAFLQNDGSGNLVCVTASTNPGTVTSIGAGTGLKTDKAANAPITDNGTLSVDVGTGADKIVQMGSDAKLPAVDGSKLTNVVASGLSSTASINTSGNIATSGTLSTTGTLSATTITNTNIYTDNLYIRSPAAGGNQIRITGPTTSIAANYILRLPEALPSAGTTQVLASDDTGNLSWVVQSAGSVTSVTANAPLAVDSSIAASPKVTIQKADATHDGYLAQADWSAFNSKQPAGNYITTLTGDVSSSLFAAGAVTTSVDKIKGVPVATAIASDDQKFLKFVNGSGWEAHYVKLSELKNALGTGAAFDVGIAGCTSAQTLVWTSLTDQFKCQDISLPAGKVTGLAAVATSGNYTDLANKPAFPTCGANQYLTFNGTTFACANDAGASGTVASISSGTPALTFSSSTGTITANISDATTSAKGLVQLAANNGTTAGTVVQADDSRLTDSRAPSGAAGGDLTGNYPNPTLNSIVTAGSGTKITYDAKGRITASTTLSAADIPALDWTKITTGKPTTLSGYGITDAVTNAGSGAGNVITSIQSGNTAGRPAFGTDGRIYIDTQAGIIYRDSGTAWVTVASSSGTGISALTGDVTASGTGSVSATVNKVNGVAYPSGPTTNTVPVVTGANTITYQTVPLAAGGTGATTQSGAANNILPSQGSNAGKVLQTDGTNVSWVASLGTTLNSGLVWVGNGSNVATARSLNISDIKSTVSGAWFTASGLCANGTSLQYVSASDTVSCQAYSLTSSQVTTALGYTPANGTSYVAKAGDSMTGMLTLATGTTTLAPLRVPAGTLVTTPVSGNIESDGTNLYYTSSTPTRQKIAAYTGTPVNGQLLIGNGTGFSLANITAGSGVSISNSAGGISISATGSGGSVTNVSSANTEIAVATGTTTPVLTLNSTATSAGAGDAGKIAKLNASGVIDTTMIPNLSAAKITSGILGVANGGTGLSSGTSGGIPYYSASTTMASSAALTANGVVLGGGAGAAPTSTAAGAANSVLRVPAGGGAPAFGAIDLAQSAAVTGILSLANGGTGSSSAAGARSNLGLGTAATQNTGSASGNIPLLGVGGLTANKMCTSDGTASGIICTSTIPTGSQWVTSSPNIYYNTGNVGIGTTNPTTPLHVQSAISPQFKIWGGYYFTDNNLVNSISLADGSGNDFLRIGDTSTSSNEVTIESGVYQTTHLNLKTGFGGNINLLAGGNVGIGTTAPTANLQVASNSTSHTAIDIGNLSTGGENWRMQSVGASVTGRGGNFEIWRVGDTNKLTIQPGGNVGIGTTIPSAKLDVNGDALINGLKVGLGGGAVGTNTAIGANVLQSNTTGAGNTASGVGTLNANTTGSSNTANGAYTLYSNTTAGFNTANGAYALYSNTTGSNNTANGLSALMDNTTGGNNTANGAYAGRYIANGSTSNSTTNNSVYIGANTKASADGVTNENVFGYNAIGSGSNSVTIGSAAVTKTIINGNVGIGTTSTNGRLSVARNLGVTPNASPDATIIVSLSNPDYSGEVRVLDFGATSNGGGYIRAVAGAGKTGHIALLADSNVGVGTTSPTQALDVVGNIKTNGCLYYASSSLGTCASDERIKKDVHSFDLGLDSLLGIRPVSFKYNGLAGFPNDGQTQLGVIAQDVEKVAPALVKKQMVQLHPEDKNKTEIKVVDYGAFTYVIMNAIKEMYHRFSDRFESQGRSIASVHAESVQLKIENSQLRNQVQKVEQENAMIKDYLCQKDPNASICHR